MLGFFKEINIVPTSESRNCYVFISQWSIVMNFIQWYFLTSSNSSDERICCCLSVDQITGMYKVHSLLIIHGIHTLLAKQAFIARYLIQLEKLIWAVLPVSLQSMWFHCALGVWLSEAEGIAMFFKYGYAEGNLWFPMSPRKCLPNFSLVDVDLATCWRNLKELRQ